MTRNLELASRALWADAPEPALDAEVVARLGRQSRGTPGLDLLRVFRNAAEVAAEVEIHEALALYGRALAGEPIELPPRAAVVIAHRMLPDDRRGFGRDVLDWRASKWAVDRGASGVIFDWLEQLEKQATGRLFFGSDAPGRLVLQVTGPPRRRGRLRFGLHRFQRDNLIIRELGYLPDRRLGNLVLSGLVYEVADLVVRRWEKRGIVGLLDHALRGQLDLVAVAVSNRIWRDLVLGGTDILTARGYEVDPLTGEIKVDPETGKPRLAYRVRRVSLDTPRFDDDAATEHDYIPDSAADVAARCVEDRSYIRAAIAHAPSPTVGRRWQQMVDLMDAWPGPRKMTAKDLAKAMGISVPYIKKLKRKARAVSLSSGTPR